MKKIYIIILFAIQGIASETIKAQTWSSLGTGVDGRVYSIASFNSETYVGGIFSHAGGVLSNNIAKWNGSTWSAITSGTNGRVATMIVFNGELYIGGSFSSAGTITADCLAKWNGSSWSAITTGLISLGACRAMIIYNSELYAAIGSNGSSNTIIKYNGAAWSIVSTTDNSVDAFTIYNNALYAGGRFTVVDTIPANSIAKWDGTTWTALGAGTNNDVGALAVYNNELYAGGTFSMAGGNTVGFIAKWDGTNWTGVGTGTNNWILSLATFNNSLYAGGVFGSAGSSPAIAIAKWDGTNWTSLGSGMNNSNVYTIGVINNQLYAGGVFTLSGTSSGTNIAVWNDLSTGIKNNESVPKNSFSVYPNPSNDFVTLRSNHCQEFSLVNVLGKTIRSFLVEGEYILDVKELSGGVYYFKNTDSGNTLKFIVAR